MELLECSESGIRSGHNIEPNVLCSMVLPLFRNLNSINVKPVVGLKWKVCSCSF